MKHSILTYTLGLAALCAYAAFGQAGQHANLSQGDRTFVNDMARGNMSEIELGKLAQQKASNSEVKQLADRIVNDHTNLNDQLKQWAQSSNVTLPNQISSTESSHKQHLESLSGNDFDKAYIQIMLSDHQHDIHAVQQEAEHGQDQQVKQLAQKALPLLEDHVRLAENAAGQLGINASKGLNKPNR
jgi:putative membrane protein